jgi:peptide/nickel transport system substrate-binding protein
MTFHDGEPVTVEDIKFSFNFHEEHSPIVGQRAQMAEEIEIVGDRTLNFKLIRPYAPFFSNVLTQVTILPQHIWEGVPDQVDGEPVEWDLDDYEKAIGSGPFEFNYWRRDEEVSMTAYEDHFNPPVPDEVVRVHRSSVSGLADGLEEGSIDMVGQGVGAAADRLSGLDHLTVHTTPSHAWQGIQYNCTEGPFRDIDFRHAMAHTIDKQHMVDVVKTAPAEVIHTPIAPANEFWHNPDVRQFNFDMDQARQILSEAGWGWDDEGRLHYPPDWGPDEPHDIAGEY